jgi:hypothetical protein
MKAKKIAVLSLWAIAIAYALWGLFNLSHPNSFMGFLVAIFFYLIGNEMRIEIIKEKQKRERK